jgi:tRNA-specific 2-thiouridylase
MTVSVSVSGFDVADIDDPRNRPGAMRYAMKILVGMSGGIDSSVAAKILKDAGHDVVGVTMTIWKDDLPIADRVKRSVAAADFKMNSCFSPDEAEDIEATKAICEKIGIEHHVLDCSDLYESTVLRNFKEEYLGGRTPNPCVWCNALVKFGALIEYARRSGIEFDKFATGHYAQVQFEESTGRWALRRAVDRKKDQSYFLYRLGQDQLATVYFPLGGMTKDDVRKIDEQFGFHRPGMEESQDFYGGDYSDLLGVDSEQGNIVDTEGKVLGRHEGVWNYTIGQRRGLGVAAPRPLYVLALRPATNEVVVGYEEDTYHRTVRAGQVNWGAVATLAGEVDITAKIRSTGEPKAAVARVLPDGRIEAVFKEPVKAATPGQSLVLYQDDTILAGGIIDEVGEGAS